METIVNVRTVKDVNTNRHHIEKGQRFDGVVKEDSGYVFLEEPYLFYLSPDEIEVIPDGEPDVVNHPPHYKYEGFEVIDILDEAFPDDPHLWAAGKYLLRAKRKGNEKQDLEKAIFFIQRRLSCLTPK